jgi:ribonuclease PH
MIDYIRRDGRRPEEMRPVNVTPDYNLYPEGSILFSIGNSLVLCNLTIEKGIPRWMQLQEKSGGWITAEYNMLPRSTHKRISRESISGGRSMEISRLIGRSLRATVDLAKIGSYTYLIDCDVIQADGGTRTAAITGGYLALALGIHKRISTGELSPDIVLKPIAGISVGILDNIPVLDLTYEEDSQAEVDFNIVMSRNGDLIEVQGTAEKKPFSREILNKMLDIASRGINTLFDIQNSILNKSVFSNSHG